MDPLEASHDMFLGCFAARAFLLAAYTGADSETTDGVPEVMADAESLDADLPVHIPSASACCGRRPRIACLSDGPAFNI